MDSDEDDTLLTLIYQHLQLRGYRKAAKKLEKYVTQADAAEGQSSLQDIYSVWKKLSPAAVESEDADLIEETNGGDAKDLSSSENTQTPVKDADEVEPLVDEEGTAQTLEEPETKDNGQTDETVPAEVPEKSESPQTDDSEEAVVPVDDRGPEQDLVQTQDQTQDPKPEPDQDSNMEQEQSEPQQEAPPTSDLTEEPTNETPAQPEAPPPDESKEEVCCETSDQEETVEKEQEGSCDVEGSKVTDFSLLLSPERVTEEPETEESPEAEAVAVDETPAEVTDTLLLNITEDVTGVKKRKKKKRKKNETEPVEIQPEPGLEPGLDPGLEPEPEEVPVKKRKHKKSEPQIQEVPLEQQEVPQEKTVEEEQTEVTEEKKKKKRRKRKKSEKNEAQCEVQPPEGDTGQESSGGAEAEVTRQKKHKNKLSQKKRLRLKTKLQNGLLTPTKPNKTVLNKKALFEPEDHTPKKKKKLKQEVDYAEVRVEVSEVKPTKKKKKQKGQNTPPPTDIIQELQAKKKKKNTSVETVAAVEPALSKKKKKKKRGGSSLG